MSDTAADVAALGASFFGRGLTFGRTGNISVRRHDRILLTPTGACMGALDPAELSELDLDGAHLDGPRPSKEGFLHAAMYRARPSAAAVIHLHSTHSVAVSCSDEVDQSDALPPLTAYYAMRVGHLPLLPYHAPGDDRLGPLVERTAQRHHTLLLANHGPVVAGRNLAAAADAVEEIEETARLFLLLRGMRSRPLTPQQVEELAAPGS